MTMSHRARALVLLTLCAAAAIVVLLLPPLPQDPHYHWFADRRAWLGVPNAGDVLSNLGFAVAAAAGLLACRRRSAERGMYAIFFAGIALTSAGSAYYHLAPDHERLVWDRLPMTLGFMALLAAVTSERVDRTWARRLLAPQLVAGLASVLYWISSERAGAGDLRPYVLVQFLSLLAIAGMLVGFPRRHSHTHLQWAGLAGYALAKLCETLDARIFAATAGLVSGHTLKHLLAAAGIGLLARYVARRREL